MTINESNPEVRLAERTQQVREYWQDIDLDEVRMTMPSRQRFDLENGESVYATTVNPSMLDYDRDNPLVLEFPYLNGWTPHHFIRAKVMQQIVAPEKPVILFPNNSIGEQSYVLNAHDQDRLKGGDISPIAEKQMKVLESMGLGSVAVSGYSMGGLVALALGSVGSDKLSITQINADEAPCKQGRSPSALTKDFITSGGNLGRAIEDAEIPALDQAKGEIVRGVVPFIAKSLTKEGRMLKKAMSGSAEELILQAIAQVGPKAVKLGYVEGSEIFDKTSISLKIEESAEVLLYRAEDGYRNKHATADNVIAHAYMVDQGLNSWF